MWKFCSRQTMPQQNKILVWYDQKYERLQFGHSFTSGDPKLQAAIQTKFLAIF